MFASLRELQATHEKTGGWDGRSPGYFFDGHTGEREQLELLRGRYILVTHLDRDETADNRRVLYSADDKGRVAFVSWLGFGVLAADFIDRHEAVAGPSGA
jgi:hypothetical protein